jgi:hypothetical protein
VPTRVPDASAVWLLEHWMPLARQALHLAGGQIDVVVWPTVHEILEGLDVLTFTSPRHYSFRAE